MRSLQPQLEIPDVAITPFVLRRAEELADASAIVDDPTGETWSYSELSSAVRRLAGGLIARGFRKGDVFAILLPNRPEYVVAFHGVALAGGMVTTINPTYTADEVARQLEDSGARALLADAALSDIVKAAVARTKVSDVYFLGAGPEGAKTFADLYGEELSTAPPVDPAQDVAALPYSSGTTGVSKGVMLTHRNLVANLLQLEPFCFANEPVVSVLPFFHIYGMQLLMNGVLARGGKVVTQPRFDLEVYLAALEAYAAPRAYVVPPIMLALARDPRVDDYDLSSLRSVFCAAAPLGAELATEVAERLGCVVEQGYGMTEASPGTHMPPPGKPRVGAVGVLAANTEARIVDPDTGADLDVGEDGEIWVRGPQVMKGYLGNPEATRQTIVEGGWLRTGDIGHVDGDGYFFIVDRLKEMIKVKGFQVAPAELEAILLTHPAVADGAVVPFPDEEAGEIPKAFVVLADGAEATAEELMDFVGDRVAHYKRIRAVELIEAIPKSPSGKILRRVLRKRWGHRGGWEKKREENNRGDAENAEEEKTD